MTVEVRGCSTSVTWVMKVGRCARRRGHQGPQNQCFGTPEAYLGTPEAYLLMTYYLTHEEENFRTFLVVISIVVLVISRPSCRGGFLCVMMDEKRQTR